MPTSRTIFHVDMDAFFAAIEVLDQPHLAGKAILVGHAGTRGVVSTASYEARKFGCHSAQPMAIARRRCPHAIVLPVRGGRYREVSEQLFRIFDSFAPLVEPLSIDEAFLDMTGAQRLFGPPEAAARQLKDRIHGELGLTASVGIAPNKFLAKLASDFQKPDGLTIVNPDMVDSWLAKLPIARMWGAGPAAQQKLQRMGVNTIGDLGRLSQPQLTGAFGELGRRFAHLAHGRDNRPVTPDSQVKSIGQEQTFATDVTEIHEVRRVMLAQVEQVARRLRKHGLVAQTVTVKIRFGDFQTITRSCSSPFATDATGILWHHARRLLEQWAAKSFQPVRLVGVTASRLNRGGQMSLFDQPQQQRARLLDGATDKITDRFGKGAIQRGSILTPPSASLGTDDA